MAEAALEHRVITVPGGAFGSEAEKFLRLSFCANEETLTEGMRRVAGALAFLGYRLYRRWRTFQVMDRPALPPWEEALAALDAMPWRGWVPGGQGQRYSYALSPGLTRDM